MKKKYVLLCSALLFVLCHALSACEAEASKDTAGEKQYTLQPGRYEFQTATLINVMTNETEEKTIDELFDGSDDEFAKTWDCLLNFGIAINEDTVFITKEDKRRLVINDSFVYEVVGDNTLQFHMKRWSACDNGLYEVFLILSWVPSYG